MPTGTALVMVDSQYKFIAHLPFYDELYDNSKWSAPQYAPAAGGRPFRSIDFEAMVKRLKRKQMESALSSLSAERKAPGAFPFSEGAGPRGSTDIDLLVSKIDAKIAELEAEELAERKKQDAEKNYPVVITDCQGNRTKIARLIAAAAGESLEKAAKRLAQLPVELSFRTKGEALRFVRDITNAGGKATIKTS